MYTLFNLGVEQTNLTQASIYKNYDSRVNSFSIVNDGSFDCKSIFMTV